MSVPSKADAEGGKWSAWVAAVVAQRDSEVDWPSSAERQVLEHRDVMEHHLGRPLRKGETVHHRDGNRSRNTIDNLELWTGAQPSGRRAADLLAWAEEIVARYGPERHLL
jgi:HNH endonuclease